MYGLSTVIHSQRIAPEVDHLTDRHSERKAQAAKTDS